MNRYTYRNRYVDGRNFYDIYEGTSTGSRIWIYAEGLQSITESRAEQICRGLNVLAKLDRSHRLELERQRKARKRQRQYEEDLANDERTEE